MQWVPGSFTQGVKQQGHEADHSPPTSAEDLYILYPIRLHSLQLYLYLVSAENGCINSILFGSHSFYNVKFMQVPFLNMAVVDFAKL
jgi:hypothetical protein